MDQSDLAFRPFSALSRFDRLTRAAHTVCAGRSLDAADIHECIEALDPTLRHRIERRSASVLLLEAQCEKTEWSAETELALCRVLQVRGPSDSRSLARGLLTTLSMCCILAIGVGTLMHRMLPGEIAPGIIAAYTSAAIIACLAIAFTPTHTLAGVFVSRSLAWASLKVDCLRVLGAYARVDAIVDVARACGSEHITVRQAAWSAIGQIASRITSRKLHSLGSQASEILGRRLSVAPKAGAEAILRALRVAGEPSAMPHVARLCQGTVDSEIETEARLTLEALRLRKSAARDPATLLRPADAPAVDSNLLVPADLSVTPVSSRHDVLPAE